MFHDWYELLKIASLVLGIVGPIIYKVWQVSSRFDRLKRDTRGQQEIIDKISDAVGDHTSRIKNLESLFENLPNKEDFSGLLLLLEKMNGKVDVLSEREKSNKDSMSRIERIVQRQQDHLWERDK